MKKTLAYSTFAISVVFVVVVFLTAKSYAQLGVAAVLYPLLAFFAYKLFVSVGEKSPVLNVQAPPINTASVPAAAVQPTPKTEDSVVVDIDRRAFLKLIGATGLSFFLFSLLGRRVESLFFDRALETGNSFIGGSPAGQQPATDSFPTAGYKITEIDEDIITYYGFINDSGGWLIMKEDTENNSFRYTKGDSRFPANWDNRENLQYDYFHNL